MQRGGVEPPPEESLGAHHSEVDEPFGDQVPQPLGVQRCGRAEHGAGDAVLDGLGPDRGQGVGGEQVGPVHRDDVGEFDLVDQQIGDATVVAVVGDVRRRDGCACTGRSPNKGRGGLKGVHLDSEKGILRSERTRDV